MKNNRVVLFIVIGGLLLLCLCTVVTLLVAGGVTLYRSDRMTSTPVFGLASTSVITIEAMETISPLATSPVRLEVTETVDPVATPTPQIEVTSQISQGDLFAIQNEPVPLNDPIDLAQRLEGKTNIPKIIDGQAPVYQLGDEKSFYLTESVSNETFQVQTKLRYITDHLYFWIEDGVLYDQQALQRLCEAFENQIYPTDRAYFGEEWSPGVDNDPHLYVVYARGLGGNVAGAFSASDEYPPEAREFSNAHEMFVISADLVNLNGGFIYGTMAHEFQHMIHWHQDRNEETWLSEGFSTLAQLVNGYKIGGSDFIFSGNPDLQLNTWPNGNDTIPYYGASYLFAAYFLDRFGQETIKDLIALPENGLEGVDRILEQVAATDPETGSPVRADDVFGDWVVANYMNDPKVEDGRYAYYTYQQAPKLGNTEEINSCSPDWSERDVRQYGADYIQINCSGDYTVQIEGAQQVGVVPVNPYSGEYSFWSNKGDESNMTLTRSFDLSAVSGPITFKYQAWYDLEEDYDYLFLEVSENGSQWEILHTPSGTGDDPTGNSYGWGYNGTSGGWLEESVDLSRYAGKKIQVRFEYVTDLAVNGEGFLLDDIQIPEIQYTEGFETGDGGWEANGFVRIQNRLPQSFQISIIRRGDRVTVETVKMKAGQSVSIPLGEDIRNAVLVVSGTTRFTRQPAVYRFRFEK